MHRCSYSKGNSRANYRGEGFTPWMHKGKVLMDQLSYKITMLYINLLYVIAICYIKLYVIY